MVCPTPIEYSICCKGLQLDEERYLADRLCAFRSEKGLAVAAIQAGPGKRPCISAAQLLVEQNYGDVIIDTGTAGALNPELAVGDIVCGDHVYDYDNFGGQNFSSSSGERIALTLLTELTAKGRELLTAFISQIESESKGRFFIGGIAGGEKDVNNSNLRNEIFTATHALACTWESFAVIKTADRNGAYGFSLRVISDLASEGMEEEYKKNCEKVLNLIMPVLEKFLFEKWLSRLLNFLNKKSADKALRDYDR